MAAALACIPVERRLTASHPTTTTPFAKLFKDPFYSPLLFCRRQESRNPRLSFPSSPHKGGLAVLFSSFLVPASLYFLPATLSCVPSLNTVTTFRMENALRFGSTSLPSSSHVKEGRVQNAGISRTCDMKSAAAARHSDDRDRGLFVARKEREGFLKFPYVCVREREREGTSSSSFAINQLRLQLLLRQSFRSLGLKVWRPRGSSFLLVVTDCAR